MIETNNKKLEVFRNTLVSRTDIHQAKTEAMQEKMDVNLKEMKASQEHVKRKSGRPENPGSLSLLLH
jgi:hypothetical protein